MAVSPEEARRELARRELERRQSAPAEVAAAPAAPTERPLPQQPIAVPGAVSPLEFGKLLLGPAEIGLTAATGLASLIPAGLTGIATGLVPGGMTAAEGVEAAQENLTFQPRLESSRIQAEGLARPLEALDTGLTDLFDTGNPLLSAGLKTGIEAATAAFPAARGFKALKGTPRTPGPTTAELYKVGREQFNRARELGGGIVDSARQRLTGNVTGLKNEVGLPVRINEKLHPKSAAVREEIIRVMDSDDVSFDDLIEVRQLASDAAGAIEKDDAFRGLLLKNQIDDFVDNLSPADMAGGNPAAAAEALNNARSTWAAASKASTIEQRIALAGDRAGQFSGSGFENALRTEFRQLKRRITKGQERGFTPAEVLLIDRVANGDNIQQALTLLGKLAPTGVISGGVGAGAGFALGGPVGAAAVPLTGAIARRAATTRRINSANAALEAVQQRGLLAP